MGFTVQRNWSSQNWTPPSGGGGGTLKENEPSGMTQITDVSWSQFPAEGWWNSSDASRNNIITDANAPYSPSDIYEKVYATACGQSTSCGTATGRSFWASNYTEAYVAFWWKMSSNFQGHSSGVNKVYYIAFDSESNNFRDKFIINNHTTDQNQATIQVRTQSTVEGARNLTRNVGSSGDDNLTRGAWHRIECHVVCSDPGSENGEVHLWLDGTKVIGYTDIGWIQSGENKVVGQFKYDPIWGGNDPEESIEAEMYYYQDHFYGSGK